MGWDTSKINVNGGVIAFDHPIGASGCRVLVSLLHEMQMRIAKRGLASLCIGGSMGVALTVEHQCKLAVLLRGQFRGFSESRIWIIPPGVSVQHKHKRLLTCLVR